MTTRGGLSRRVRPAATPAALVGIPMLAWPALLAPAELGWTLMTVGVLGLGGLVLTRWPVAGTLPAVSAITLIVLTDLTRGEELGALTLAGHGTLLLVYLVLLDLTESPPTTGLARLARGQATSVAGGLALLAGLLVLARSEPPGLPALVVVGGLIVALALAVAVAPAQGSAVPHPDTGGESEAADAARIQRRPPGEAG